MTRAVGKRPNCFDLPLEVVDKYFMADAQTERFQFLTALRMCGQCAVQAACLVDAIKLPATTAGIRGGEPAARVSDLRRSYQRGEASAERLALNAIKHHEARLTVETSPVLRGGNFADVPLIETRPKHLGGRR